MHYCICTGTQCCAWPQWSLSKEGGWRRDRGKAWEMEWVAVCHGWGVGIKKHREQPGSMSCNSSKLCD